MNLFWSFWIIIITVGTLIGLAAILRWCLKNITGIEEGTDIGHEYDGIRELNNPIPKWWTYLFFGTFLFATIYLALYPGLGNFKGLLGWQSSDQNAFIASAQENKKLDQFTKELDDANRYFGKAFNKLVYSEGTQDICSIPAIASDHEAIQVGQRIFLQNCSQCHGSDGRGQKGFPNLTDRAWLYGGEPEDIVTTLRYGRAGHMPAWKDTLGIQGVKEVVNYTLSLSGRKVDISENEAGKSRFAVCTVCHGTNGKGNPTIGAPDLTDNDWLYGGSRVDLMETVLNGRSGVMPAWQDILGDEKIQLVSAYVWSLSNSNEK